MKVTRKYLRKMILKEMSDMGMTMRMGGGSQISELIDHLVRFNSFLKSHAQSGFFDPRIIAEIDAMVSGLHSGPSPGLINALKDMFLGNGFPLRSPKIDSMLAPIRSILSRM